MKVHKLVSQFLSSPWAVVSGSYMVWIGILGARLTWCICVGTLHTAPVCLEILAVRFSRICPVVGRPKYGLTFSWISLAFAGTCLATGAWSVVLAGQLAQRNLEEHWTGFPCDWALHTLHISFDSWAIPVSGEQNQVPAAAFAPSCGDRSSTRGHKDPDFCAWIQGFSAKHFDENLRPRWSLNVCISWIVQERNERAILTEWTVWELL